MARKIDARRLGLYVVGGVGTAYLAFKLVRYVASSLLPDKFPGEPNTLLLATPRPSLPHSQDDVHNRPTAKDLENVQAYDYIVVGGGTAGCVLASRLTEDPAVSVLVIESGHSDLRQLFSRFPAGYTNLFKTSADHDLITAEEPECDGRAMQWPRGKMLGGCSAINAQIYNKGSPDDYDEWASQGLDGWSYNELEPYMRKAESFTPNSSQVALTPDDLSTHGTQGPWQIGYTYLSGITTSFLSACAQAGFDRVNDINTSKGTNGAVRFQTFISKNGQRSSTATAYLTADVLARPNLRIATGQNVTQIIFDTSGSTPHAVGVELATGTVSPTRYLVRARSEVLLSAGAVHSPHILKLSGIGPATELSQHNIPLIADLPHVGANLADHLICKVNTRVKPGLSVQHLTHPLRALVVLVEWLRFGTGAGTTNTAESALFYRVADHRLPSSSSSSSSSVQEAETLTMTDQTSGPRASDMEILSCAAYYMDHGRPPANLSLDYHSMGAILLRPEARGSVTLTSASPFTKPLIRANYLSTPHDRAMMLHGLRTCQKIAETDAYRDVLVQWETPEKGLEALSDEEVEAYVRATSETIYHPMCTARMGRNREESVVDARLKVHGVRGLRVVDASVFPSVLACHPCAPVVMVAEKAADMIKEDRRST